ncbi:hypothetical protein [Oceanobacillus damuensis]|uniref:hypothetical protein n=1 Tax=Oceanobacillus damuensis TaxID=937928 RepID=UPI000B17363E|nr:hypothetical protein [Oceanobacillus damuensis]
MVKYFEYYWSPVRDEWFDWCNQSTLMNYKKKSSFYRVDSFLLFTSDNSDYRVEELKY